jgi:hypothetical protein
VQEQQLLAVRKQTMAEAHMRTHQAQLQPLALPLQQQALRVPKLLQFRRQGLLHVSVLSQGPHIERIVQLQQTFAGAAITAGSFAGPY